MEKLTVIAREEYHKLGKENNKEDKEITREEMKKIEKSTNEHMRMWCKIINAGESHNHFRRIIKSKTCKSELSASKYYIHNMMRKVIGNCLNK